MLLYALSTNNKAYVLPASPYDLEIWIIVFILAPLPPTSHRKTQALTNKTKQNKENPPLNPSFLQSSWSFVVVVVVEDVVDAVEAVLSSPAKAE